MEDTASVIPKSVLPLQISGKGLCALVKPFLTLQKALPKKEKAANCTERVERSRKRKSVEKRR